MSKFLPINLFIRQGLIYPLTAPFLPPVDKVEKGHKYAAGRLTGTLVGGGLPFTGQITQRVPNDDGDYQKGLTLTRPIVKGAVGNTRFVINGDGTITDSATGLMWIRAPQTAPGAPFNGKMSWANAIINCEALTYAGHNDWRLPNVKEMVSILDFENATPPVDGGIFTDYEPAQTYWTSTTDRGTPTRAWRISAGSGYVYWAAKTSIYYAFPVRLGLP